MYKSEYSFMKVNRMSRKADYVAKNASSICEIWFINKGKLVSIRKAAKCATSLLSQGQPATGIAENLCPPSFQYSENENKSFSLDLLRSVSANISINLENRDWIEGELVPLKQEMASCSDKYLNCRFTEDTIKAEALRNKATEDQLKNKNLELLAGEAMRKVKLAVSSYLHHLFFCFCVLVID